MVALLNSGDTAAWACGRGAWTTWFSKGTRSSHMKDDIRAAFERAAAQAGAREEAELQKQQKQELLTRTMSTSSTYHHDAPPRIRGVFVIRQTLTDITEIGEARFRLLQCNRVSQRSAPLCNGRHARPAVKLEHDRTLAHVQTAIAITEPLWVATASRAAPHSGRQPKTHQRGRCVPRRTECRCTVHEASRLMVKLLHSSSLLEREDDNG